MSPLDCIDIFNKIAKVIGVHWWKCIDNGIWQRRLSWERGIHFSINRHLGSQDEGRQVTYGLDLRRGGVVRGMDIHKLAANQAGRLTNMGICDHVVSWVDRIRSRHSMTSGYQSHKCTIWICNFLCSHHKWVHVWHWLSRTKGKMWVMSSEQLLEI